MIEQRRTAILTRFGIANGQVRDPARFTNLAWYLNDEKFGFGDMSQEDIDRIAELLDPGEVFRGFNEHHMSRQMQRQSPMVEIDCTTHISYPERTPVTDETWAEIEERHSK